MHTQRQSHTSAGKRPATMAKHFFFLAWMWWRTNRETCIIRDAGTMGLRNVFCLLTYDVKADSHVFVLLFYGYFVAIPYEHN